MEGRSSQDLGETWLDVVDKDLDEGGPQIITNVWKDQGVLHHL